MKKIITLAIVALILATAMVASADDVNLNDNYLMVRYFCFDCDEVVIETCDCEYALSLLLSDSVEILEIYAISLEHGIYEADFDITPRGELVVWSCTGDIFADSLGCWEVIDW